VLILRRKVGQWVEITHKSGETIRVWVCNIRSRYPGQLDLAFDDPERNFTIQRPERGQPREGALEAPVGEKLDLLAPVVAAEAVTA
jgi:hypothetical protein